jgi:hypothetical protein
MTRRVIMTLGTAALVGGILIAVFALSYDFGYGCRITECFEEAREERAVTIWWGVSISLVGLGVVVWAKTGGRVGFSIQNRRKK